MNLRDLIAKLDGEGRLMHAKNEISAQYDLPAAVNAVEEHPIYFHNVKGSAFSVIAGLCSSRQLFADALEMDEKKLLFELADAIERPEEPEIVAHAPCQEVVAEKVNLDALPIPTHFATDGGPYISSAVAIIRDPETGRNACFHRLMKIGKDRFTARLIEGRQTATTYKKLMKQGKDLEIAFCIGNSTATMLGASISPAPGVDELGIANALDETRLVKCKTKDLEVPADSEIVLEGRITAEQTDEGPFVDLTETKDIVRKQPVIVIDKITHRRGALFQTLLPGKREHKLLMGMPREPTIYNEVKKVCECRNVVLTLGGCSWLHAVVQIKKKDNEEPKRAIEAAFKGHSSLKHCIIVDEDINPSDPGQVEWALATRFRVDTRVVVKNNQPSSSLDPMAEKPPGKKAMIAKVGLDATIPLGDAERPREKFMPMQYKKIDMKGFI